MASRLAMLEIHRVVPIQVGVIRHPKRILRPQSAHISRRLEAQGIRVFTQTIEIGILRQLGAQAEVLRFEDEGSRRGVEEDLVDTGARDGEGEGVGFVVELEVGTA